MLAGYTIRSIEYLLCSTSIQCWVQMRNIGHCLHLANIKDIIVARPHSLLPHVIADVLGEPADVMAQVQGALACIWIVCTASTAFQVNCSETVAGLLTKVISLTVVRVGEYSNRRADKVLLMSNGIARPWKECQANFFIERCLSIELSPLNNFYFCRSSVTLKSI